MPIILTTWEAEIRRIKVPGQLWLNVRPYLRNTHHTHKKDWQRGSSGRVPAQPCPGPEFKYH
jgi:hypothetical protein